jgi:hypothetical protein
MRGDWLSPLIKIERSGSNAALCAAGHEKSCPYEQPVRLLQSQTSAAFAIEKGGATERMSGDEKRRRERYEVRDDVVGVGRLELPAADMRLLPQRR